MTIDQAKEILLLYRPHTTDADDPQTAEALALSEQDGELHRWLAAQLAAHEKIRRQFAAIPVPEGLPGQIVSERPAPVEGSFSFKRVAVMFAVVAGLWLAGSFLYQQSARWWQEREAMHFARYSEGMVMTAISAYGMDLETNDLQQIRAYLAARHQPADYALPASLTRATPTGCVAANWYGRRVSMICFRSPGKAAEQGSDLWFFVIDRRQLRDAPQNDTPQFSIAAGVPVAGWSADDRTYLIAYQGDVGRLKAMLQ